MKSTTGWIAPNAGASNSSGFSGLPGGYFFDGLFLPTESAHLWSSSENGINIAWHIKLYYNISSADRYSGQKSFGLSCRCVKD